MSVRPNEASSANNVYAEGGVLKKRTGYTKTQGIYVLGGEYNETSTGYEETRDGTVEEFLSQEVELDAAATGGDVNFDGTSSVALVIALKLIRGAAVSGTTKCYLYTVDGSGFPDTLIATGKFMQPLGLSDTTETWAFFEFAAVQTNTSNMCIVMGSEALSKVQWYYSNGGGGYLPGASARVASYYDGAAWNVVAGVDFLFQFYHKVTGLNYRSIFDYHGFDNAQLTATVNLAQNHQAILTSIYGEIGENYSTMLIERQRIAYRIYSYGGTSLAIEGSLYCDILPATTLSGSQNAYVYSSMMVMGVEDYIVTNHFNGTPMRIYKGIGVDSILRCAQFEKALAMAPSQGTPLVWGTSGTPHTGEPAGFTFTGLTNPITRAQAVMWHKKFMVWGNVIINSVEYRDRFYYSAQTTPEAGYGDNNYQTTEGNITAMISVGDYAIVSTRDRTYAVFGDDFTSTYERIEHASPGGAISPEALCVYRDELYGNKIYGFSYQGMFEIDRMQKRFIHHSVAADMDGIIPSDMFACPDYRRGLVLFSYRSSGTRKILGYHIRTQTWWPEDLTAGGMTSIELSGAMLPRIYGFKDDELWDMYTGKNDDGGAIAANYKMGPAYLNADAKYKSGYVWLIHGNEDTAATLTVNIINDYGTTDAQSLTLRNTSYPDDVPVRGKVPRAGTATSVELEVSQDAVDESFKVAKINVEAGGGRNISQGAE
jgi:hypothetical protein